MYMFSASLTSVDAVTTMQLGNIEMQEIKF